MRASTHAATMAAATCSACAAGIALCAISQRAVAARAGGKAASAALRSACGHSAASRQPAIAVAGSHRGCASCSRLSPPHSTSTARGFCNDCSDQDFAALIVFMSQPHNSKE